MSLSIPFPFGWLLNKKAARVEVNILLAFLHCVGIALHRWPVVSDIAIFVLKGDVKLQLTSPLCLCWDIQKLTYNFLFLQFADWWMKRDLWCFNDLMCVVGWSSFRRLAICCCENVSEISPWPRWLVCLLAVQHNVAQFLLLGRLLWVDLITCV